MKDCKRFRKSWADLVLDIIIQIATVIANAIDSLKKKNIPILQNKDAQMTIKMLYLRSSQYAYLINLSQHFYCHKEYEYIHYFIVKNNSNSIKHVASTERFN